MTQDNDLNEEEYKEKSLPSFSFVPIFLLAIAIFFLGPFIGKYVTYGLIGLLVGGVLFEAFSPSQFNKMTQTYPEMDRSYWILNSLLFHLLLPVLITVVLLLALRFLA
jgi:hypothetical protein